MSADRALAALILFLLHVSVQGSPRAGFGALLGRSLLLQSGGGGGSPWLQLGGPLFTVSLGGPPGPGPRAPIATVGQGGLAAPQATAQRAPLAGNGGPSLSWDAATTAAYNDAVSEAQSLIGAINGGITSYYFLGGNPLPATPEKDIEAMADLVIEGQGAALHNATIAAYANGTGAMITNALASGLVADAAESVVNATAEIFYLGETQIVAHLAVATAVAINEEMAGSAAQTVAIALTVSSPDFYVAYGNALVQTFGSDSKALCFTTSQALAVAVSQGKEFAFKKAVASIEGLPLRCATVEDV